MKLPDWLKVKRQEKVHDHAEVTLALRFAELGRAMGAAGVTMSHFGDSAIRSAAAMEAAQRSMLAFQDVMNRDMVTAVRRMVAAEEVRQAGLEARMYVRGAMDPAYATPEARDAYARNLFPEQAAAFLRGWVEHHAEEDWPELSGVCMCGADIRPDRSCGEPYHTPVDQSAYLWSRRP